MPVYDYRCTACSATYDVFHKTRENPADVVCPSCGSNEHTKLMSVPAGQVHSDSGTSASYGDSCSTPGGCCGGACGVN